jgi:hypothetical protein
MPTYERVWVSSCPVCLSVPPCTNNLTSLQTIWKDRYGIQESLKLIFLLFADDQVIIADAEYNLQKAAGKLSQIITEYGLTISVEKTKSMAFKGRDPVRTKIVINNKIIEQVNSFDYLGIMISYEKKIGH